MGQNLEWSLGSDKNPVASPGRNTFITARVNGCTAR
ncbi:MAG: hypothetical protein CM15mP65_18110 [Crocinitomicaceae bacterium]|nr:MAG: hypothetical protein CM15mP65_18110 [Crocinitomicaceae bacterium]